MQVGVREDSYTALSHIISVRLIQPKLMNKFPNIYKVITDAIAKTNGKSVVVGRNAQNTHQRLTSPSCLRSIMLDVAASS